MSAEQLQSQVQEKLRTLVRHAAQERVRDYTRNIDFKLTDLMDGRREGSVLGNWMALILMGGNTVRMTLKLHFAYKQIKVLAQPIFGVDKPEDVSDAQATDFVKELCNLIAGYVVQIFEANGLALGISLPLCTRGLSDVFADYTPASKPLIRYSDLWVLEEGDIRLPGTVLIEIMDLEGAAKLLDYQPEQEEAAEDDDEGFDFL